MEQSAVRRPVRARGEAENNKDYIALIEEYGEQSVTAIFINIASTYAHTQRTG